MVNYDIFWAVFDKNRVTLRKIADKLKYKKEVTFDETFNTTSGKYEKNKVINISDRNKKHIIRFAIPWIPGFDAMLGKKDSLARTQKFCIELTHNHDLMDPNECYFSTPSFVVNEDPESWNKVRYNNFHFVCISITIKYQCVYTKRSDLA